MAFRRIYDEEGKGFYTIFSAEKVERVNPIKYYKSHELAKRTIKLKDLMILKFPEFATSLSDKFFVEQALKTLEGFFENMEKAEVDPKMLELFVTDKKKDQIKLLKETSINPDQLI
ncbi:MAG: hypothetical protein RJQ09_14855 [Cyclobacteriaceae bacterium]